MSAASTQFTNGSSTTKNVRFCTGVRTPRVKHFIANLKAAGLYVRVSNNGVWVDPSEQAMAQAVWNITK